MNLCDTYLLSTHRWSLSQIAFPAPGAYPSGGGGGGGGGSGGGYALASVRVCVDLLRFPDGVGELQLRLRRPGSSAFAQPVCGVPRRRCGV